MMTATEISQSERDEIADTASRYYREHLKPLLEPQENGKAVAIHVPTGDYAVGSSHAAAARSLRERHERDGKMVSLTIGPPTPADNDTAQRYTAYNKR